MFPVFLLCGGALCNGLRVPINERTPGETESQCLLLSHMFLVVVFIVLGVEAVEDCSPKREDGGSPGQAVAPVELVVHPQTDRLDELDGEEDQAAHLEHHCRGKQEREKVLMSK